MSPERLQLPHGGPIQTAPLYNLHVVHVCHTQYLSTKLIHEGDNTCTSPKIYPNHFHDSIPSPTGNPSLIEHFDSQIPQLFSKITTTTSPFINRKGLPHV